MRGEKRWARWFAVVYEGDDPGEEEYCRENYDEMLNAVIRQTNQTVCEMLSEIPESDFAIKV